MYRMKLKRLRPEIRRGVTALYLLEIRFLVRLVNPRSHPLDSPPSRALAGHVRAVHRLVASRLVRVRLSLFDHATTGTNGAFTLRPRRHIEKRGTTVGSKETSNDA